MTNTKGEDLDYVRMLEAVQFMQIAARRALVLGSGAERLMEALADEVSEEAEEMAAGTDQPAFRTWLNGVCVALQYPTGPVGLERDRGDEPWDAWRSGDSIEAYADHVRDDRD